MPWVFVLGMAAGTMLPIKRWVNWPPAGEWNTPEARDAETIVKRTGNASGRHPVDVLYGIDGDTFAARVHLEPGINLTTRIRLRGIDAPELKGQCAQEIRLAEAAGDALNTLLREGAVTIYNIGPDKYPGRVVADVATKRSPNVSAALLGSGHARGYTGGRRSGWCGARS
ncbi:MAG: hypothetical protein JWQ24_606 [Tardiphaga sp.]|nr:hypothetical protein [Tardiphaga sp.]